jgi:hypothetical protein
MAIGTHPVGIHCNGFRILKRGNTAQVKSNPLTIKLQQVTTALKRIPSHRIKSCMQLDNGFARLPDFHNS